MLGNAQLYDRFLCVRQKGNRSPRSTISEALNSVSLEESSTSKPASVSLKPPPPPPAPVSPVGASEKSNSAVDPHPKEPSPGDKSEPDAVEDDFGDFQAATWPLLFEYLCVYLATDACTGFSLSRETAAVALTLIQQFSYTIFLRWSTRWGPWVALLVHNHCDIFMPSYHQYLIPSGPGQGKEPWSWASFMQRMASYELHTHDSSKMVRL